MGCVKRPLNADSDGLARCIKANYYKMGWTNFTRNIGGGTRDGFAATGILEEHEEDNTDKR